MAITLNLSLVRHFLSAPFLAARDAWRAFRITPFVHVAGGSVYDYREGQSLLWTFLRRLRLKLRTAKFVWHVNMRTRLAPRVWIPLNPGEGFFSNFNHVLTTLYRTRPGAEVHVEWTLSGEETGFRYGQVGDNVWNHLFRPIQAKQSGHFFRPAPALCYTFCGHGKVYLKGAPLARQRQSYHRLYADRVRVENPRVLAEVERICDPAFAGRFCVGVHKRVANAGVAACQEAGSLPSTKVFIERVRALITDTGTDRYLVFLATDDAPAVRRFQRAFGANLIVRDDVKRTSGDQTEVHYQDWGVLSLTDAEDVLIDALVLARCHALVHASSSISSAVGIMNPTLRMVHI